ncbi:MAG: hypothetical protein EP329_06150, partial [Deltaproteobacteria bacterium]
METVVALVLAGFAGLMGVALTVAIHRSRAFRRAVRHTADVLGLDFEPGGLMRSPRAHGQVDGLAVEVRHVRERGRRRRGRDEDPLLYTQIRVSGGWRKELSVRPRDDTRARSQGFLATLGDALGGSREVLTADPVLDANVVVRGVDRFDTLSRLGAASRAHLNVLVGEHGGEVRDGSFVEQRRGLVTDPEALATLTRAAVGLGRRLSRGGEGAEAALAAIVRDDP